MKAQSTESSRSKLEAPTGRARRWPQALALVTVTAAACVGPPSSAPGAASGNSFSTGKAGSGDATAIPYEWKSVTILGGGFVTGIIFSPVKAGVLYARTDIGGAYRYDPAGKSWIPITDFVSRKDANYLGIESMAADPVNADRVYMAVGMYTQGWAGPGAFMRSDDQGNTWRVIPMSTLKMGGNENGRSNGERLAIDPNQPKILYFGSRRNGLLKSTDEAESFNAVDGFPVKSDETGLGISFVMFDAASGKSGEPSKILYAGVSRLKDNLYRSTDAGQTWVLVPKQPSGFMPSRAAFDKDGQLYISYGDDPGPYAVKRGALYFLDPKKDVWTDISPIQPTEKDGFGFGAVAVDPSKQGVVIASTIDRWSMGGEVFRSTDSGKTWKPLMAKAVIDSGGAPHTYHHREKLDAPQWMGDIKIDPFNPGRAMTVDGGGIWATEDLTNADKNEPTHWSFHNKNLEETAVRGLISPPQGAPLLSVMADLCGFRHDALDKSPSRGKFQNPTCANGDAIDFAELKPNIMARIGNYPWDGSKLPRGALSNDGGASWTQFATEPPGSNGSGSAAISADGSTVIWMARDAQAARTTDGGKTWTAIQGLPAPAKVPDWAPLSVRIASDRVNPKKFYAFDALGGYAFRSEDGGAHFQQAATSLSSLPEYNLIVASMQAVPGQEGHVWVTFGKELAQSTDSGTTYTMLSSVEESYALGFGHPAPGQRYPALYLSGKVGGVTGFFRSDDTGQTFVRINDDTHQYGGSNVIIGDPRVFGRVYVAPGGRGILYGEPK